MDGQVRVVMRGKRGSEACLKKEACCNAGRYSVLGTGKRYLAQQAASGRCQWSGRLSVGQWVARLEVSGGRL